VLLPPRLPVVGNLPALDLEGDHARTLEHRNQVDLEVLGVVGDPLPGDEQIPWAALGAEPVPHCLFRRVDQAGLVGKAAHHRFSLWGQGAH